MWSWHVKIKAGSIVLKKMANVICLLSKRLNSRTTGCISSTLMEAILKENSSLKVTPWSHYTAVRKSSELFLCLKTSLQWSLFHYNTQRRNLRSCKVSQILQSNQRSRRCLSARCRTRRSPGNGLKTAWRFKRVTASRFLMLAGWRLDNCSIILTKL